MGVEFKQIIPHVSEDIRPGETPSEYSQRLAIEKAQAAGRNTGDGQITLACDTIVVHQDSILEKPVDRRDAWEPISGKRDARRPVRSVKENYNAKWHEAVLWR